MLPPKRKGFTLIEMMIVIAIFVISASATVPLLNLFNERQTMSTMSIQMMQVARRAQSRSLSGVMGVPWNIYVGNDFYALFAGTTYPGASGSSSSSVPALGTLERHDIEEPLKICTDRPDGLIPFPIQANAGNIKTFIRLYNEEEGGAQRFILIDTIGSIRITETHPDGLTCTAPEPN